MELTGSTLIIFAKVLNLLGISPEAHKMRQESRKLEVEDNRISYLLFNVLYMDIVSIAVAWFCPPCTESLILVRLSAQNFITSINLDSLLPLLFIAHSTCITN